MSVSDAAKQRLIHYFAANPAWIKAAKPLADGVCSRVRFAGEEGDWNLVRRGGVSVLEPGTPDNPDFLFVFSEGGLNYLTAIEDGSIGDFATRLYEGCFVLGEDQRIEFQILSSVGQIVKRGYWIIALKGGLKVLKIAREHGLGSLNDFKALAGLLSHKGSEELREAIRAVREAKAGKH